MVPLPLHLKIRFVAVVDTKPGRFEIVVNDVRTHAVETEHILRATPADT